MRNVASVCLQIGYPTIASVPHSIVNGYKRVLAVAVETDYTFPLAEKVTARCPAVKSGVRKAGRHCHRNTLCVTCFGRARAACVRRACPQEGGPCFYTWCVKGRRRLGTCCSFRPEAVALEPVCRGPTPQSVCLLCADLSCVPCLQVKAFLADPSAFVAAIPVAAEAAAPAATTAAAPAKEAAKEESEESDEDMGFGLFD